MLLFLDLHPWEGIEQMYQAGIFNLDVTILLSASCLWINDMPFEVYRLLPQPLIIAACFFLLNLPGKLFKAYLIIPEVGVMTAF